MTNEKHGSFLWAYLYRTFWVLCGGIIWILNDWRIWVLVAVVWIIDLLGVFVNWERKAFRE